MVPIEFFLLCFNRTIVELRLVFIAVYAVRVVVLIEP